jgi:hypothetical protein
MCGSSGSTQAPPPKPATQLTEVPREAGTTVTAQPQSSASASDPLARSTVSPRNPNVISSTDDQQSSALGA